MQQNERFNRIFLSIHNVYIINKLISDLKEIIQKKLNAKPFHKRFHSAKKNFVGWRKHSRDAHKSNGQIHMHANRAAFIIDKLYFYVGINIEGLNAELWKFYALDSTTEDLLHDLLHRCKQDANACWNNIKKIDSCYSRIFDLSNFMNSHVLFFTARHVFWFTKC